MKKKIIYLIIIFIALIVAFSLILGFFGVLPPKSPSKDFNDCAQAGNPILETFPPQCRTPDGKIFTEAVGILRGKVSVGPICPVERIGVPCPVPPAAYTSREAVIYLEDGVTELTRKKFNPDGTYSFELTAGDYIIGIPRIGVGGSKDLPHAFSLKTGETVEFNFSIDTGIR